MYQQGLLKDEDIYSDLKEIIVGTKPGRENNDEIIYFNTVGMSYVDVMLANHMYKKVIAEGLGHKTIMQEKSMFDVDEKFIVK